MYIYIYIYIQSRNYILNRNQTIYTSPWYPLELPPSTIYFYNDSNCYPPNKYSHKDAKKSYLQNFISVNKSPVLPGKATAMRRGAV